MLFSINKEININIFVIIIAKLFVDNKNIMQFGKLGYLAWATTF